MTAVISLSAGLPTLPPAWRRALTVAIVGALILHAGLLIGWLSLSDAIRAGASVGVMNTRVIAPAMSALISLPETTPEPPPPIPTAQPSARPSQNKKGPSRPRISRQEAAPSVTARGASTGSADPQASLLEEPPLSAFGGGRPPIPHQPPLNSESAAQALEFSQAGEPRASRTPRGATLSYRASGTLGGQVATGLTTLSWRRDIAFYEADWVPTSIGLDAFLLGSVGLITDGGQLLPVKATPRSGSANSTQFDYSASVVRFSSEGAPAPLLPGTQDSLSAIIQIAAWLAADSGRYIPGQSFELPVADNGAIRSWRWLIGPREGVSAIGNLRGVAAIKLKHVPGASAAPSTPQIEVWLAPALDYLPIRMRMAWPNGDTLDQVAESARLNSASPPAAAPSGAAANHGP